MKIHGLREIVGSAWYLAEPSLPTLFSYPIELYHEISNNKNMLWPASTSLCLTIEDNFRPVPYFLIYDTGVVYILRSTRFYTTPVLYISVVYDTAPRLRQVRGYHGCASMV